MSDTDKNMLALFSAEELLTLQALHMQYQVDNDRFSDRERARLRFVRWLHEAGRVDRLPKGKRPLQDETARGMGGHAEDA